MQAQAHSTRRRQVPRRPYQASIGLLYMGKYLVEQTYQISEGGLMVGSARMLNEGDLVVLTFRMPTSAMIIVRGIVRSIVSENENQPQRYGLEFQNLEFSAKREIRNYVAAATTFEQI